MGDNCAARASWVIEIADAAPRSHMRLDLQAGSPHRTQPIKKVVLRNLLARFAHHALVEREIVMRQ